MGRVSFMENVHLGIIWGHVNWSRVRIVLPRGNSVLQRPGKGTGFQNKQRAHGHLLSCLLLIPQHPGFSDPGAWNYDELVEKFLDFSRYLLGESYSHSFPPMSFLYFEIDT